MDPLVAATFALQTNPGAYALLLGSGVSSSAGIPTGHAVMLDLIRKVAHLCGEPCEPDPIGWYRTAYSHVPNYSLLLEQLGGTVLERQSVLRGYFEASEDDRASGVRMPGPAHHAIARLVASRHVRIVVTLNFDRLLERALEDSGAAPVVISSAEQAIGCLPLAHQQALVIKANGDYLGSLQRNSEVELSAYPEPLARLLGQVFEEYGLIVCGWSATYDLGMRALLQQRGQRRFTTFWVDHGEPSEAAVDLIRQQSAKVVRHSADQFFASLADGLESLERFGDRDPVSSQVGVARLKRYVGDPRFDVDLQTLVMGEALRVSSVLRGLGQMSVETGAVRERIQLVDGQTELLRTLLFNGALLGDIRHARLWTRALREAAPRPNELHYVDYATRLRDYPGLVAFYAAGTAAVASDRPEIYCYLLTAGKIPRQTDASEFVERWHSEMVLNYRGPMNQEALTGTREPSHSLCPLSAHVFRTLRKIAEPHMHEARLREAFNYWDLLVSLFRANCQQFSGKDPNISIGLFAWSDTLKLVRREISDLGEEWPPFTLGLFGGDVARVMGLLDLADTEAVRSRA